MTDPSGNNTLRIDCIFQVDSFAPFLQGFVKNFIKTPARSVATSRLFAMPQGKQNIPDTVDF